MIIYVSDTLNSKKNGGASTSGFDFLQFLRVKYEGVAVITSDKISQETSQGNFYGSPVKPMGPVYCIKRHYPIGRLSIMRLLKKCYHTLNDLTKKSSFDVSRLLESDGSSNIIYVNSWSGVYISGAVKNLKGYTKVCVVRGSPESFIWQSFEEDKNEAVQNAADYLQTFDKLIFVSERGMVAWNKLFREPIECYYLPNSIDELEIERVSKIPADQAQQDLNLDPMDYNVVVVGSIQMRKAQDILGEVIEGMVKVKPNIKIHLIGVVSAIFGGDKIKADLLKSKYAKNFIFHGHSDQALLFMKAADLTIFTSRGEAFPRTVAEYMALGKPIIAADVSGVGEMIKDRENGLLYDPAEPAQLLACFENMIGDEEKMSQMAINARETYWATFSKRSHIKKAVDIFAEIDPND